MNKLLQQQLQKHFGRMDKVPGDFMGLFSVISESYDRYEKDRKMIEHSMKLSAKEMIGLKSCLKTKKEELSNDPAVDGIVNNFSSIAEKIETERQLHLSEERYRYLFYNNPLPMWIYDNGTLCFLEVNDVAIEKYGYSREEFLKLTLKDIRSQGDIEKLISSVDARMDKEYSHSGVWKHLKKNGDALYMEITSHRLRFEGKEAILVLANDVTEKKKVEERLEIKKNSEARLKQAQTIAQVGHWEINFATNLSRWSDEAYRIYGMEPGDHQISFEGWLSFIHPEDMDYVLREIEKSRATLSDTSFCHRVVRKDGVERYVLSEGKYEFDPEGRPTDMYGIVHDLTERKRIEHELRDLNEQIKKRAEELAASNAELERFAYVASHDLQEPLRMVSSFLQLLQRKYANQLDETAGQYINYAVDGAERMKRLILDLLEYSRVGTNRDQFINTDISEVVSQVLQIFNRKIPETDALIKVQTLPVIKANRTQMMQLFQNLVGNALKYNNSSVPEIEIGYEEKKDAWQFFVKDNGIGIEEKYFDKVFAVFQRLHNKTQFSGTGIGLAICKKIVEKHEGNIWINSRVGEGSIFFFTIKKVMADQ